MPPREPELQDLPALLAAVVDAAGDYRSSRAALDASRARLAAALAAAHAGGASLALLGRLVGVSRQRIREIIDGA